MKARKRPEGSGTERDREILSRLPEPLLDWYRREKRDLPWRRNPSPYQVWISEIMLQQTRIETAKGYYERFLREFPDVNALAEADETAVLKLWEGLGYYSRARNLMKAAALCAKEYGGELPASYEKLRKLPGIGPYTAGAIGSIAFRLPVPAVDGNVLRVLARVLADESDISRQSVRREAEKKLAAVLPEGQAGEFNQALMELGETVCVPSGAPDCEGCPLAELCLARAAGNPEDYPVKSAKRPRRVEEKTILLICCRGRYAIRRRPAEGLLAGMYEFPWLSGRCGRDEVRRAVYPEGGDCGMEELPRAKHIFSHVEWQMTGWRLRAEAEPAGDWQFFSPEEIRETYPIPTAYRRYTDLME